MPRSTIDEIKNASMHEEFNEELFTILKGSTKEIDWFKIDLRIRKVVGDVLAKFKDDLVKIQKLSQKNYVAIQVHHNRIEECEKLIDRFKKHQEDYSNLKEEFKLS